MCIRLSTMNNIQTEIKAGVPSGNPDGVNDQFFNCTRYLASRYLSIIKCVSPITKTALMLPINKNGIEYSTECIRQAKYPIMLFLTLLIAIQ